MIPTLFVNENTSMIIPWEIVQRTYFPKRLIPEYVSYELYDAYRNVVDALSLFYGAKIKLGIQLSSRTLECLKDKHWYLSGNSLGFAWLIGFVAHLEHILLPSNWFAWGSILPTRNRSFVLGATCHTDNKTKLAFEHNASCIFAHQGEKIEFIGRKYLYEGDMLEIIKVLREVLLNVQSR